MMKTVAAAAIAAAALAGCSQANHGTQDSPVSRTQDNTPAQIINFPDGFFNVAEKCDHHGHRIYSNTRDGAQVAVIEDKACPSDWEPTG
jgi:nitrous oxide reductase accessory protein NosL